MTPTLRAACKKAVHVLTSDGRTLRAGRATLFILGQLGWPKSTYLASFPPLIWLVELGYQLVARNRKFWSRILRSW